MVIEKNKEWYGLFVVDTLSRIKWNLDSSKAHTNQNKCMEVLQDLCQNLWVVIILLHHTNKAWTFEWSQKIMDLSNVFLVMARDEDWFWDRITKFTLTKDKFITYTEIETKYNNWEYVLSV
jgi:RecA-family ATPase